MRYKIFFVSIMAMLCLFFSTSTSSAANWREVYSDNEINVYIDSSNVYYQTDASGNKDYDAIQFREKIACLDEDDYMVTNCVISLSGRCIYAYDYTVYDYAGNILENGNRDGYSEKILPGTMGQAEMEVVCELAR